MATQGDDDDHFEDLDISLGDGGGESSDDDDDRTSFDQEAQDEMERKLQSRLSKNLKPPPTIARDERNPSDAAPVSIVIPIHEQAPSDSKSTQQLAEMEEGVEQAKAKQQTAFWLGVDRNRLVWGTILLFVLVAGPLVVGWGVSLNNRDK
mmetsp:Transcript_231/g.704  ORF Transcript_231/g.704 Transcript_231/m.704 type:complete len:150 (-) Transcript_231:229-678(-)